MGQRQHRFERDEYLTAKALYMSIKVYDLYPEEMRVDADRTDMRRILREQFPHYAYLLSETDPDVMRVEKRRFGFSSARRPGPHFSFPPWPARRPDDGTLRVCGRAAALARRT